MSFTLIAVMVEAPAGKIGLMFPFESGVIMGIVNMVVIMSAPGWVSVIGMPRVMSFKKAYTYLDLGIRRTGNKTSRYDQ